MTGISDREVAEKVGVARSTVTRWRLYHPAFQAELNIRHQEIRGNAIEKLRSLLPEAVDTIAEVIRDKSDPHRAKYALELIRAMRANDLLPDANAPIEAEDIIKRRAERPFDLSFEPDIEHEEDELEAKLNGMTYEQYVQAREIQEEEERRRTRERGKVTKGEMPVVDLSKIDQDGQDRSRDHQDGDDG